MKHNIPTQHDDNKLKSILNGYPSVVPSSGEQAMIMCVCDEFTALGSILALPINLPLVRRATDIKYTTLHFVQMFSWAQGPPLSKPMKHPTGP